MAPVGASGDTSATPLADYFFICGIESSRIFENGRASNGFTGSPILGETIEESTPYEPNARPGSADGSPESKRGHARFSFEARKSISSVIGLEAKTPSSNRSSVTIRPTAAQTAQENDPQPAPTLEEDFDNAMKKFADARDTFLDEIQFSAGQIARPNRPRPRPKTVRITNDDSRKDISTVGSIRRRISTMNPLSRTSTSSYRASARQSKRISGYNSVMPAPAQFKHQAHEHPLKRLQEPVLLDRFPTKEFSEEPNRRKPFPDYVPMFVFPNDVNVISADERPRSTWHGFTMTQGDGAKLYGMTIIVWQALHQEAAVVLERQCEEWRNEHMTKEEREMAKDLTERLATERAKLSELLSDLPAQPQGTKGRDELEEEINQLEDRISLMSDALRPVRHGAASKIDGLTDGETGFWIPRAYGILGRDVGNVCLWKDWLRAVVVPMMNGAIMGVPPSSPRVGTWQPLESYVLNVCIEAPSPMTSMTQVELAVRELRIYSRREAINEIPGSRTTDLYPLFRCMDVPDVVVLFEYLLAESRIILLSSHTAMLYSATAAITQLLYPLKWSGIFIPVLPARLIRALEAPVPYIVGIERRYESVELPEDDFVLVDLDQGVIEATHPPMFLPRQQRRKLVSILQLAAPHRYRYGVPLGPPKYMQEAFPFDTFPAENRSLFEHFPPRFHLSHLANLSSASFGNGATNDPLKPPIFSPFALAKHNRGPSTDRPTTSSSHRTTSPPSPTGSPSSTTFPQIATKPLQRAETPNALQATLREKRSGRFDGANFRRNSSFGMSTNRRPSIPFMGHNSTTSVSTIGSEPLATGSNYAPSVYAQSTLAASTIMPQMLMQPVHNTGTQTWIEGHCLQWQVPASLKAGAVCSVCDDRADDGVYACTGCKMTAHNRCTGYVCLVCPAAFHQEQIYAAFARCFASLLYTYRKYMVPLTSFEQKQKHPGLLYSFNVDAFLKSVPHDSADYLAALRDSQAFQEFVHERETRRADDPAIRLFDEIILSKRNRGRSGIFGKSNTNFLADVSDHLWHTAAAIAPSGASRHGPRLDTGTGDNAASHDKVMGRVPAKLDPTLMREPRVVLGVQQVTKQKPRRKQVPSVLRQSEMLS